MSKVQTLRRTFLRIAKQSTYLGSDCSSAVSMAYQTVNAGFQMSSTVDLYPVSGRTKKVGSYSHNNQRSSTTICTSNGSTVMKNSYKILQPGDLLFSSSEKHVMMVTEIGSNYVKVTHQTKYSSGLYSTWCVNEW